MCNESFSTINKEKKILIVVILTIITMSFEIAYGYITNSMSLLADGWHMGTHALALGLTYIAYVISAKLSASNKFSNGTDKIGTLAGYTSSLFLLITGFWIIFEAFGRIINPIIINFNEAIVVAIVGLIVNGVSIFIMENKHTAQKNKCHMHKEDYNFMAAYYHILSDAVTSVLAIFALVLGKLYNIVYLDCIVGILGGLLIIKWSVSMIKASAIDLIDMNMD